MVFELDKNITDYISDGWVSQNVGPAPQRLQQIPGNLRAQRKQYGLKHRVTATIHASMGYALPKVALEISQSNSSFKL